ncbi:hypothetical protein JCM19046_3549 [Bacillus sp. JCM 19046]|nr:hypothetical protein JCM19045_4226 [Bacillus sp. JCM 19045]GAF18936.1 hypothetical protein JCM19046_3549 [Bacillus sp. JCM 19046]
MNESLASIKHRCIALVKEEHAEGAPHTLIDSTYFRNFDSIKGSVTMALNKQGYRTRNVGGDLLVSKF